MHITKDNIGEFIYGSLMDCSDKGITRLEYIPDGIRHLYCYNNKLTELPKLPEGLVILNCEHNKLTYEITIDNIKEHNKLLKRKLILKRICV